MEFIELVKKRESTRKYADKPVSRELIDRCLEAARLAPSACNSQPWSFIIIDDEDKKNQAIDQAMAGIYSMNKFARTAPVLIVVVTERSSYTARLGGMFRDVKYNLIDIGIVCDHLTLQAAEIGLGTCWLGWFNEKALKKSLGLAKNTHVDIVIAMGYPEDETAIPRPKKRNDLDDIRSYL